MRLEGQETGKASSTGGRGAAGGRTGKDGEETCTGELGADNDGVRWADEAYKAEGWEGGASAENRSWKVRPKALQGGLGRAGTRACGSHPRRATSQLHGCGQVTFPLWTEFPQLNTGAIPAPRALT